MTDLSPAAEAVLNAYENSPRNGFCLGEQKALAAALRAAADQVVPEEPDLNPVGAWSTYDWNHMNATKYQREESRRQLLAIAAELEEVND
jgi:hypothetical protein